MQSSYLRRYTWKTIEGITIDFDNRIISHQMPHYQVRVTTQDGWSIRLNHYINNVRAANEIDGDRVLLHAEHINTMMGTYATFLITKSTNTIVLLDNDMLQNATFQPMKVSRATLDKLFG